MSLQVSVIIPTYNGVGKILNALKALESQQEAVFEVIVVVDGSLDNTVEILQKQNFDFLNFRIIEQENRGRSGSRNRGAKEAAGDLLIFFDDDMRPIPECITLHLQHHQTRSGNIIVGTQTEERSQVKTDIQQYKAHLTRKWEKQLKVNNGLIPKEKPFLTAANFSISKDLFWQLGGFDENLTDAEDFDLAVRASQMHISIYFVHEAIAWHDDFITCRSYIKRQRQYRTANQSLRASKPALYQHQSQYVFNAARGLKRFIYIILSHRFWVRLIDHTSLFHLIPRPLRYKLYAAIITGLSVHFPNRSI